MVSTLYFNFYTKSDESLDDGEENLGGRWQERGREVKFCQNTTLTKLEVESRDKIRHQCLTPV